MSTSPVSDKQTVVITGTSRGIGYHLACRFLSEGYRVIGLSRTATELDHSNFTSMTADISDTDAVEALKERLGGEEIAGLINNAGIHGPIGPFEQNRLSDWMYTFQVNLFGAAALTQVCIPSLRANRGFMIFLSGGGSANPRPDYSAYGVSKSGVVRFSEVLAEELAPEVKVYCVAPGPNRTGMQEEVIQHGGIVNEEDYVDFSLPEDLCLFLARNTDARYSGKFIHVMDDYNHWEDTDLSPDLNTLRRLDRRTLSRFGRP
jgi:short-subunit dehydrogenase